MNLIIAFNCDSKLIPTLIVLLENSGEIFEGEINITSLNFFISPKSLLLIRPIIIFTPSALISLIAEFNFLLSLNPNLLGQ